MSKKSHDTAYTEAFDPAASDSAALSAIDERIEKANSVTKRVSEREALIDEANKLLEMSAAGAFAAKELHKRLQSSVNREKALITRLNSARDQQRISSRKDSAIHLKECLEIEAELLNSYSEDYRLSVSAKSKKDISNYRKKITNLVKQYNTDVTHFGIITRTEAIKISDTYMAEVEAGMSIVPMLIVPEYLKSQKDFDDARVFKISSEQKETIANATSAEAARLERLEMLDIVKDKEDDALVRKYEAAIDSGKEGKFVPAVEISGSYDPTADIALTEKYTSEREKVLRRAEMLLESKKAAEADLHREYEAAALKTEKDKEYKTVAAAPVSSIDIPSIVEKTTNKKLKKLEMLKIDRRAKDESDIRSYNAVRARADAEKADESREIKRAMADDYEKSVAIDLYNKKLQKLEEEHPELTNEEARLELISEAERLSNDENFIALARRDFRRHIRDEKKDEKSIIKDIRRTRKKYTNSTVRTAALPHLRESIGYMHELLERYIATFDAALHARHKKYMKVYEEKVSLAIDEYRADLDLWKSVTGEAVPVVQQSLIDDIKAGKTIKPVPMLDEEFVPSPKNERRLKKKDLLNFMKAEKKHEKRARQHEKEMSRMTMDDGEHIVISKFHMDTDLDTVKSRIEYRKEKYITDLRLMRFHFGDETPKEMKKHRGEITKLAKMKRQAKKYIRYEKKNNERYLKLANLNLEPLYAKSEVHKERLEILQNRIRNLLLQRDEVNMRLLTLYAEENANPEKKRKTNRQRIAKVKLRAAKRSFKKQFKLYKLASKYRVPEAEKERIYEIMNRKIQLRAYLAECKFRKRHERPGARKAKRVLRSQIKDTKLKLKYAERDFKKFMRKASRRSRRTPNPKIQILWCFVLLAMLAVIGGIVYVFMYQKELVSSYTNQLLDYIKRLISKNLPGQGG